MLPWELATADVKVVAVSHQRAGSGQGNLRNLSAVPLYVPTRYILQWGSPFGVDKNGNPARRRERESENNLTTVNRPQHDFDPGVAGSFSKRAAANPRDHALEQTPVLGQSFIY